MQIDIISYQPEYAPSFYELNIEWLKTFFYVEPYDDEVLSNPKKYIIDKGGHIFFAKHQFSFSRKQMLAKMCAKEFP